MTAYATNRDLYTYGLRRGVISNEGRLVASSLAATDILELDGHLFETGDRVQVRAVSGGTLSAPLVAGTVYYVIRVSDSTFKLSATDGGAAIDLTSNGDAMLVIAELPISDLLEAYSRFVDEVVPHAVPLQSPYPKTVVRVVCELTAAKLLSLTGQSSTSIKEAETAAKAQLERWGRGVPIRGGDAGTPANLAVVSSNASASDPRGWGSGSLP
jgi:hypothetical protein